jgi:hypothetical protein
VARTETVTVPAAVAAPMQIGGKPLSSLLVDKNVALSDNKRATAEMKVIGVINSPSLHQGRTSTANPSPARASATEFPDPRN